MTYLYSYRLLNSQKFIGIYRKMKSVFWRDVYSDSKDLHQKMIHIRVEGMPKNLENTTGNMSSCTTTINIPAFIYTQNYRKMEHDSKTVVLCSPSWAGHTYLFQFPLFKRKQLNKSEYLLASLKK